jgi:pimeloyl-ACP methyl ester carboxylesterase
MKSQPPVRTITLDGQELAYALAGQGPTSIVLINGAGGPLLGWYKLYPDIERLGRVFAYDRPGSGNSPRAPAPQTGRRVVSQLRSLLDAVGLPPPFILVAHSFGGLFANLFARLHPDEVAGVVFVEATSPDDVGLMKRYETTAQRSLRRLLDAFLKPDPNGEVGHENESVEEIRSAPGFPPVPVIVLSGGKAPPSWLMSPEALAHRTQNQRALAQLSPGGEQILAQASGHFPQMSEPALVLAAIRMAVDRARAPGAGSLV